MFYDGEALLLNCKVEDIETIFDLEPHNILYWNPQFVKIRHVIICDRKDHAFVDRKNLRRNDMSAPHHSPRVLHVCGLFEHSLKVIVACYW